MVIDPLRLARTSPLAALLAFALMSLPSTARGADGLQIGEGAPAVGDDQTAPDPEPETRPAGFRLHGYVRSGYGVSDGQAQEPFRASNADAKYRLVGLVAPVTFGDTHRGWATGVRLETWW